MRGVREDLTGRQFGKLTVLRRLKGYNGGRSKWVCRCQCGKTCTVMAQHLKSGRTRSCGCVRANAPKAFELNKQGMIAPSESLGRLRRNAGEPYQNLANAIVCVAADDYRMALRKGDIALVLSLTEFFQSAWYRLLTRMPADFLLALLQKEEVSPPLRRNDLYQSDPKMYSGSFG